MTANPQWQIIIGSSIDDKNIFYSNICKDCQGGYQTEKGTNHSGKLSSINRISPFNLLKQKKYANYTNVLVL